MFFSDTDASFRILSVLDLEWQHNDTQVMPRPFHALSLRLKGNAYFTDNTHSVQAKNGDLMYMPAQSPYYLRSSQEHIIAIHFEMNHHAPQHFELFAPENVAVFDHLFHAIHDAWKNKKPGYYWKSMSILYQILEEMTRQFNPIFATPSYQRLKNAISYMYLHFTDPSLCVATLCKIADLSGTQFRKLFSDIYGTTPLNYINKLRTDYAAQLLSGSFFGVEEIAAKSGFSDPKHFCTVFRKYRHYAPSVYKKRS